MIIQMLWHVSGGRADGRHWPAPYTDFEVGDEEGEHLVQVGQALFVRHSPPPPEPEPEPEPQPEPEPPVAEEPVEPAAVPAQEDVGEDGVLEPPAPSALKQDWIDYAVVRGEDPEMAAGMTKVDLMSKWGPRL